MNPNRNVLILSAGRRVELVQIFQEALQKHFSVGKVFATDMKPQLSAACQIADDSFIAPRVTAPEYIDFLLNLCKKNTIGLVIPTIDTELIVLSINKHRFDEIGVNVIISDHELVMACRDKRKTADIFVSLGIDQPHIYNRDAIQFPCFCKPYDGSCSIGAQALFDESMLNDELLANEKNMFMELIGKEYSEYTIDAYYSNEGTLCCLVPRERLEVRAGEVSKGATRKNFVYNYLREKLPVLKGARGCITVQVFANPESKAIKALEINPRFGGGFPLSHAAGANYPDWLVREYLCNEEIEFYENWENNLIMLRYDAKVLVHESDK